MNNKKVFALKFIFFSAAFLAALYLLDFIYTQTVARNICNKTAWIFNAQNNKYDFAVLGDSRVFNVVDVKAIEKHSGMQGINLGTSGSKPMENYLILDRFLQTNTTKVVLMQLDVTISQPVETRDDKTPFYSTYQFMPFIHQPDVDALMRRFATTKKYLVWKYVPFARYAEFNTQYPVFSIAGKEKCEIDEKGYEANPIMLTSPPVADSVLLAKHNTPHEMDSLMEMNLSYVDKIVELCRQKNIPIVFFTSPYHVVESRYSNVAYCDKALTDLGHNKKIPYWNFNSLFWGRPDSLYGDTFHTNQYAGDELGANMADSLKSFFVAIEHAK